MFYYLPIKIWKLRYAYRMIGLSRELQQVLTVHARRVKCQRLLFESRPNNPGGQVQYYIVFSVYEYELLYIKILCSGAFDYFRRHIV